MIKRALIFGVANRFFPRLFFPPPCETSAHAAARFLPGAAQSFREVYDSDYLDAGIGFHILMTAE